MSMVSQQNQAGISLGEIDRVIAGTHHDPHSILGAHSGPDGVIVRVLRPLAKSVTVVLPDGQRFLAEHVHEGVFAVTLPVGQPPDYRVAVSYADGDGGTLLDNSVILYGSPMGDSNVHNHKRVPMFVAGRAGGALKGNLHVKAADGTPMANAMLTVAHALGLDLPSFGDSTGELDLSGAAPATTVA